MLCLIGKQFAVVYAIRCSLNFDSVVYNVTYKLSRHIVLLVLVIVAIAIVIHCILHDYGLYNTILGYYRNLFYNLETNPPK